MNISMKENQDFKILYNTNFKVVVNRIKMLNNKRIKNP